jgi:hypothetical protein
VELHPTAEYEPATTVEYAYVERVSLCMHKLKWIEDEQGECSTMNVICDRLAFRWKQEERLERAFDRALDRLRMFQKGAVGERAAARSRSYEAIRATAFTQAAPKPIERAETPSAATPTRRESPRPLKTASNLFRSPALCYIVGA